jgi:hypothetical protein
MPAAFSSDTFSFVFAAYETMGSAIIESHDARPMSASTAKLRYQHSWGSSITIGASWQAEGKWAA